ncbi:MAG: hypothetical protein C4543_07740 [Ignavibacteriales bacterium]|jgi:hypothetical protein|nr:porin family protein [Melioribacteraceae bacterium]RJP58757.1 MAG: hypothetical protein C4543_07740 [Ignavibacteriales bacterium]
MKKVLFTVLVLLMVVSLTQAQEKGKMGVSVQGGIALPTGDFGDGYDMGFGGRGMFMYYLNQNMAITGTAGFFTWSGKDDFDATFTTIPVMAGIKYFMGKGDFKPYVSGQLGMYFSSFEYTVDFGPFFGGEQTVDDSGSDFGIALGGGFLMPLGKTMNLDVSAEYDIIFTEGSSTSYLGILAGLAFAL